MNHKLGFLARFLSFALVVCVLLVRGSAGVQAQDEQIAASTNLTISVHLPAGYAFATVLPHPSIPQELLNVYTTLFVWADDSELLQQAMRVAVQGGPTGAGNFGILAVVSPSYWLPWGAYPEQALPKVLGLLTTRYDNPPTYGTPFQYSLGNQYTAIIFEMTDQLYNRKSYVGGFVAEGEMIVFSLNTAPMTDFDAQAPLLESIGNTIRYPAEAGASTTSTALATPTIASLEDLPTRVAPTAAPSALPTLTDAQLSALESDIPGLQDVPEQTAVPDDNLVLASSGDGRMSFVVPGSWIVYDLMGDYGIYAYGDTDAAGYSRLGAVRPDLVNNQVPITGIGGVIILYPMSDFGIDPDFVDFEPLMDRLIQNLQASGYEVVEPVTSLYADPSDGIYIIVQGGEYGYIVLEPFGDQIAYITATGVDEASFEPNRFLLEGIVLSVTVPAVEPTPTPQATSQSGLGGLGGLQQVTAAPTATPTSGGLGGLQRNTATPELNVTPEASPTEG